MQFGFQCFYGNDLSAATSLGPSTACTSTCVDTTKTNCGGSWANSVYTVI